MNIVRIFYDDGIHADEQPFTSGYSSIYIFLIDIFKKNMYCS